MLPSSTSRSLTSSFILPNASPTTYTSYFRNAGTGSDSPTAAAFVSRRSTSRGLGGTIPRPTRGVCSPASSGRSNSKTYKPTRGSSGYGQTFTRRSYVRASSSSSSSSSYPHQHYARFSNGSQNQNNHHRHHESKYAYANYSSTSLASSSYDDEQHDIDDVSSSRGRNAVSLLPVYLSDARAVTKYDPIHSPNGALQLSVAENQMLEDLLVPALRKFSVMENDSNNNGDDDVVIEGLFESDQIYYQPTHGREGLRTAMATYLQRILKFTPEQSLDLDGLVLGAGCNAVLENLCFCLTEPGDAVLLPTPYYAAFEFDLVARANLNIIPVHTMDYNGQPASFTTSSKKSIPQSSYYPNTAALNAAYEKAKQAGSQPKILLLSHPNNPLGVCYPPSVVKECIDWAREKKVHLVSDEIYAGSVYRKANPLTGEDTFQSALTLAASSNNNGNKPASSSSGLGLGPYIHFVYALSKDFALSGLRVGVAYSENKAIRTPMQKLNDLCQISSQTQQTVAQMLSAKTSSDRDSDGLWSTDEFLPENNDRIRQRSDRVQLCLDECDIPCLFGDSGLFLWMDLTEFLPPCPCEPTDESEESKDLRERELYLELLQKFGLLFTPGRSMRNELPGYFRFVFTAASDEEFDLGLERIKYYVNTKRNNIS